MHDLKMGLFLVKVSLSWDFILSKRKNMQFRFVYVGRLDKEKGIKDIVFAFEKILSEQTFDVRLDLFGQEGNCSMDITRLARQYPDHVVYHGRQDKSIITEYRANCHYVLMPSHFLETF